MCYFPEYVGRDVNFYHVAYFQQNGQPLRTKEYPSFAMHGFLYFLYVLMNIYLPPGCTASSGYRHWYKIVLTVTKGLSLFCPIHGRSLRQKSIPVVITHRCQQAYCKWCLSTKMILFPSCMLNLGWIIDVHCVTVSSFTFAEMVGSPISSLITLILCIYKALTFFIWAGCEGWCTKPEYCLQCASYSQ